MTEAAASNARDWQPFAGLHSLPSVLLMKRWDRGTPPRYLYMLTSFTCVAMYHLFPKASFTPALRSP